MRDEELKPGQVDMQEWEQSGQGWNALSYYHKSDEGLLLKLNNEDFPYEETVREYQFSKAVYGLEVKCPATFKFVTDGKHFGYVSERLVGKKSFARILSENPGMIEPLARDMAEAAKVLHSRQCDTTFFESVPERLRKEINSRKWIKGKMKALLNSYADGMRPVTTCLHGDMHPGNILRAANGDFWIDLGRFGYGDPDMDYANQYMLANLAPFTMPKWILHIDRATYSRFVELYGRYYYGEDFYSAETQERLRRAVCLAIGHGMAQSPAGNFIYGFYVRGHEKITRAILWLISPFVKMK